MEGPTPVSALLHSATLVLTGILLYVYLTDCSPTPDTLILTLSSAAIIIPLSTSFDFDAKKIAALSTCLMISLLYTILLTCSQHAFLLIAMCHASYKSTIFVSLAIYVLTFTSQDIRSSSLTIHSASSLIILPLLLIYSLALPGSLYALAKLSTKVTASYADSISSRPLIDAALYLNPS